LLEKQEDILYEEHDKLVNVEKSLALETKKNEILSSELSSCHEYISSLKRSNADLNARIEKLDIDSSSVEHVYICNKCKYFDVDACKNHVSPSLSWMMNLQTLMLNLKIAKLSVENKVCKGCLHHW
jgi:hypothetical protein